MKENKTSAYGSIHDVNGAFWRPLKPPSDSQMITDHQHKYHQWPRGIHHVKSMLAKKFDAFITGYLDIKVLINALHIHHVAQTYSLQCVAAFDTNSYTMYIDNHSFYFLSNNIWDSVVWLQPYHESIKGIKEATSSWSTMALCLGNGKMIMDRLLCIISRTHCTFHCHQTGNCLPNAGAKPELKSTDEAAHTISNHPRKYPIGIRRWRACKTHTTQSNNQCRNNVLCIEWWNGNA